MTKSLFGGIFAVTLAANFGILPPMKLVLDFDLVWRRFEVGVSDSVCSCASVWCCLGLGLGLGLVCLTLFLHSCTRPIALSSSAFVLASTVSLESCMWVPQSRNWAAPRLSAAVFSNLSRGPAS